MAVDFDIGDTEPSGSATTVLVYKGKVADEGV
jgi:hypothetical protein